MRGAVATAAYALLTPEQLADVVADRAIIEQARGMLMLIFDIDADQAFDLLRTQSQTANVKLRTLARHLTEQFRARSADKRMLGQTDYEEMLLSASQLEILERT
jgi:hypothetical protein